MIRKMALVSILLAAVVFAACSNGETDGNGGNGGATGIVNPTWITAQQDGDTVSIPVSELDSGKMLHFQVAYQIADMAFMAYKLDGDYYVRANVCPPCRSTSFSLDGDNLVCDSCRTRFAASTGAGISGACVDYPKAEVAHKISGASLAMEMDDLATAYENTLNPGWP
jgi:nitrite reductase/ring-hydroxylating ferredoxin subunit